MKSIRLALAAIVALGGAVAFTQTAPQLPAKGAAQTSQSPLAEDLVLHKVRVDPASGKVVAVARSKSDDDD